MSILQRIRSWPPQYVFIATAGSGLFVLMLSAAVGVFTFKAEAPFVNPPITSREVGYAAAVNWSLIYTILYPITACLMIEALAQVSSTLRALARQGMIRNSKTLQKESADLLVTTWETGSLGRRRLVIGLAIILPATLGLGEWFRNNFLRLCTHIGPAAQPPDYDWGLAGVMHQWSRIGCLANAFLDLCAFLCEAMMLGSFLAFFLYLMDINRVLPQTVEDGPLTLVPDLASEDRRRGFEVFEPLLTDMLVIGFLAYIMSYLVRVEGLYLADNTANSLGGFIQNDILKGASDFFTGKKALGESIKSLFDTGPASIQAVLAGFASLVVLCFSLIVTIRTVRTAADVSQHRARIHFEQKKKSLCGLPLDEERKRLSSMTLWPLGYLRLDVLLIGIGLALATLVYYRIGLYVTGFLIAGVLSSCVKRLYKSLK